MRHYSFIKNTSWRNGARLLGLSTLILGLLLAVGCSQQVETAQKAETRTNEAAAVRALQTIFQAQTMYSTTHPGDYGVFDQLIMEKLLDRRFAGAAPVLEGYVFTLRIVQQTGSQPATFSVNADPKQAEGAPAANARHLYINSDSNVVRANATRPATANDPPLQ